jgi:hypothetical protein
VKVAFFSLFFILSLGTCYATNNRRINALIFISDHDVAIRKGVDKDGARIETMLKKVSESTKMELNLTVLKKKKATIGSLKSWAHKIQSSDFVFFYYSGHGGQLPGHTSERWPSICSWKGTWIRGSEIVDRIQSKTNTSVIIFDCCNAFAKGHNRISSIDRRLSDATLNNSAGRTLFKDFRGCIIACGCSLGQNSFCTEEGSFFSITLIDEMIKANKNDRWFDILKRTTVSCANSANPQIPDFELAQSCSY